jgi:hypothetical protein
MTILELNSKRARDFFLKGKSYCNRDFPSYIQFDNLLTAISSHLSNKDYNSLIKKNHASRNYDGVNHVILNNKDGKYAWRPIHLVHPVLYVKLVRKITEEHHWDYIRNRFREFTKNDNIKCLSMPVKPTNDLKKHKGRQVLQWWHGIEQKSMELALDYEYVIHTDIANCYNSIYTHSIAWALHTKPISKKNRYDKKLIGNIIDDYIQDMNNGQTNGLPQDSILMDFIAEIILGYADLKLTEKIKDSIKDYCILRYRDDYRIFTNTQQDAEQITKYITEIIADLGLCLNQHKTKISNQLIIDSVKTDKLSWICRKQNTKKLQEQLLIIHDHCLKFPHSGKIGVILEEFCERINKNDSSMKNKNIMTFISIVVDIAYRNPRTYPIVSVILSKLLEFIKSEKERTIIIEKIMKKFSRIPNTGYMQIWLQRIALSCTQDMHFDEPLCKLVKNPKQEIWNNDWISCNKLKGIMHEESIIEQGKTQKLPLVIPLEEVSFSIY